jgi:acyl carrier protein
MPNIDLKGIETKIKEVLAKELGVKIENITPDKKLIEDLGMDSLASIELIFELEDKTGLEILEKDVPNLKTVGNIIEYLTNRLLENKNAKNN